MNDITEKTQQKVKLTRYQVTALIEKKIICQFISKQAYNWPYIKVLENYRVGSRDETKEKECEWQKKTDQKGENQLTN